MIYFLVHTNSFVQAASFPETIIQDTESLEGNGGPKRNLMRTLNRFEKWLQNTDSYSVDGFIKLQNGFNISNYIVEMASKRLQTLNERTGLARLQN